jgi:hypothetical protein
LKESQALTMGAVANQSSASRPEDDYFAPEALVEHRPVTRRQVSSSRMTVGQGVGLMRESTSLVSVKERLGHMDIATTMHLSASAPRA